MLINKAYLDLDLAFNPAPVSDIEDLLDESLKNLITQSQLWEKEQINWIQNIRQDDNLICPKAVRKTSSLSMGLQFTNDRTISQMNNIWRNINHETDVLSFPIIDEDIVAPTSMCIELGDIVISVTTAKRQAKEMNHGLARELKWLVSHGLLHLLGWDHPNPNSLEKMLIVQEKLIF